MSWSYWNLKKDDKKKATHAVKEAFLRAIVSRITVKGNMIKGYNGIKYKLQMSSPSAIKSPSLGGQEIESIEKLWKRNILHLTN